MPASDLNLPPALAAVAKEYAHLCEAASGAGGGPLSPVSEIRSGWISDGGATRRVALAERPRTLRSRIPETLALTARRPKARSISCRELVEWRVVGGLSLRQILTRNGWSPGGDATGKLKAALEAALERMEAGEGAAERFLAAQ